MLKRGSRIIRDRWPGAIAKLHDPRLIGNVGIALFLLSLSLSRGLYRSSLCYRLRPRLAKNRKLLGRNLLGRSPWTILFEVNIFFFTIYFSLYNFNFSISKFCSITMKVLFIDPKSFSFCFQNVSGWCFFFLLESRLLIQCSFILSFRDQKFPSIATKVINRNHFIILFCVFEVETLLYFYFCLFQVKIIYLLFRLFRLKLLIEFLNFICFYLLRPENFHYLVVILFILFYFLLFSILFPANF